MILNWAIKSEFLYKVKDFGWLAVVSFLFFFSILLRNFQFIEDFTINWIFDTNIRKFFNSNKKSDLYWFYMKSCERSVQKNECLFNAKLKLKK